MSLSFSELMKLLVLFASDKHVINRRKIIDAALAIDVIR